MRKSNVYMTLTLSWLFKFWLYNTPSPPPPGNIQIRESGHCRVISRDLTTIFRDELTMKTYSSRAVITIPQIYCIHALMMLCTCYLFSVYHYYSFIHKFSDSQLIVSNKSLIFFVIIRNKTTCL